MTGLFERRQTCAHTHKPSCEEWMDTRDFCNKWQKILNSFKKNLSSSLKIVKQQAHRWTVKPGPLQWYHPSSRPNLARQCLLLLNQSTKCKKISTETPATYLSSLPGIYRYISIYGSPKKSLNFQGPPLPKTLKMDCPHHTAAAKLMSTKLPMHLFFLHGAWTQWSWCRRFEGHQNRWALKILTFLGPNATGFALCISGPGPKKVSISGPNPSDGQRNGFARIKIITYRTI